MSVLKILTYAIPDSLVPGPSAAEVSAEMLPRLHLDPRPQELEAAAQTYRWGLVALKERELRLEHLEHLQVRTA